MWMFLLIIFVLVRCVLLLTISTAVSLKILLAVFTTVSVKIYYESITLYVSILVNGCLKASVTVSVNYYY